VADQNQTVGPVHRLQAAFHGGNKTKLGVCSAADETHPGLDRTQREKWDGEAGTEVPGSVGILGGDFRDESPAPKQHSGNKRIRGLASARLKGTDLEQAKTGMILVRAGGIDQEVSFCALLPVCFSVGSLDVNGPQKKPSCRQNLLKTAKKASGSISTCSAAEAPDCADRRLHVCAADC
jgi:hypothetical protein